jgi:hypothetical protein
MTDERRNLIETAQILIARHFAPLALRPLGFHTESRCPGLQFANAFGVTLIQGPSAFIVQLR